MSSSDPNKSINDLPPEEFKQRIEQIAAISALKHRIERLEKERDDTSIMLARMWNMALWWIWPRFTNYRK